VNRATPTSHGPSKLGRSPFSRLAEELLRRALAYGEQHALSAALGVAESWVSRVLSGEGHPELHLPASALPDVVRALGADRGERFLRELVAACGYELTPARDAEGGSILGSVLELHGVVGAFDQELAAAARDGQITVTEATTLLDGLEEVAVKIEAIRVALRQVVRDHAPAKLSGVGR
jgi:hypothetical protein